MTRMLLVEDAAALAELFAQTVHIRLGIDVVVCVAVADIELVLDDNPFDLAVVDLSFPQEETSGLDALAMIHMHEPATTLAIMTQGDRWVGSILRDAWDLLPIATVISKTAPLEYQLDMLRGLVDRGAAPVDPAIQPLLPAQRNAERTAARFSKLIQHQGHAKVWHALMDRDLEPSYRNVAERSGLKLNTVKNYRSQLLPELQIHGLNDPSLREMQDFARRCKAFLRPFVSAALAQPGS